MEIVAFIIPFLLFASIGVFLPSVILFVVRHVKKLPTGGVKKLVFVSGLTLVLSTLTWIIIGSTSTSMPQHPAVFCEVDDDCVDVIIDERTSPAISPMRYENCLNKKYQPFTEERALFSWPGTSVTLTGNNDRCECMLPYGTEQRICAVHPERSSDFPQD